MRGGGGIPSVTSWELPGKEERVARRGSAVHHTPVHLLFFGCAARQDTAGSRIRISRKSEVVGMLPRLLRAAVRPPNRDSRLRYSACGVLQESGG